ncbi:MAG: thiamine diphosphokinase [Eubacterium sp.]|jgi:thiamine pyrophosphokinase
MNERNSGINTCMDNSSIDKSCERGDKRAVILTSYIDHPELIREIPSGTVICADGGYVAAERFGLKPEILIGDYDSARKPDHPDVLLPCVKDMTDSEAAVDLAVSKGYNDILVLGGLGGRLDHTMGNIGVMAKYCGKGVRVAFADGQNYAFMLSPGDYHISPNHLGIKFKYMGLIAYGGEVPRLTVKGTKYELDSAALGVDTTLGVSNEIIEDTAFVSFDSGMLLVALSSDVLRARF